MDYRMKREFWKVVLCVVVISLVGCNQNDPRTTPTGQRLHALATAYLDYGVAKGHGPLNQTELRRHIQLMPAFVLGLSESSADGIDELFVSPRDQKPFVIRYGLCASLKQSAPLAYEKTSSEGLRFVAYANGKVSCLVGDEVNTMLLGSMKGF